jgi:hypothetical protein
MSERVVPEPKLCFGSGTCISNHAQAISQRADPGALRPVGRRLLSWEAVGLLVSSAGFIRSPDPPRIFHLDPG